MFETVEQGQPVTRIVLEVEDGLSSEELQHLQQLLRDAFGEFRTARGDDGYLDEPAATYKYVRNRYPQLDGILRERKVDEVILRKRIARKLRRAADNIVVDTKDVSLQIEEAFRAGNQAAECGEPASSSPHPADSLLNHWWTRGYAYCARLLRAIEAERTS